MNTAPSYLTSPADALAHAASQEEALLAAAERGLAEFLEKVTTAALTGNILRGQVVADFTAAMTRAFSHPAFVDVRDEMLTELEELPLADDIYTAAEMALETATNMGATPAERAELITALFAHPSPSLVASLAEKLDGWIRRRLSRLLLDRIRKSGPDDLARDDLDGREYEIPEEPGSSTLVDESLWRDDDRPGLINWRARMRRDIRTAYTKIFGRQMQRQLERYGFPYKRWVSRKDDRVRPTHIHANGQIVPINGTFEVGVAQLRYPGDALGPVGETINCRCSVIGVLVGSTSPSSS